MTGCLAFDLIATTAGYTVKLGSEMVQTGTLAELRDAARGRQSPMMYLMEVLADRYPNADGRSLTLVEPASTASPGLGFCLAVG